MHASLAPTVRHVLRGTIARPRLVRLRKLAAGEAIGQLRGWGVAARARTSAPDAQREEVALRGKPDLKLWGHLDNVARVALRIVFGTALLTECALVGLIGLMFAVDARAWATRAARRLAAWREVHMSWDASPIGGALVRLWGVSIAAIGVGALLEPMPGPYSPLLTQPP